MKALLFKALAVCLVLASCVQEDEDADIADCAQGSLSEFDLSGDENPLTEGAIIKISMSDQERIDEVADGRDSFRLDREYVDPLGLADADGEAWIASRAYGFFGSDPEESAENFFNYVDVLATYYPYSKKIVVFTSVPYFDGANVSSFWIFLRVPEDMRSVVFECSQFN